MKDKEEEKALVAYGKPYEGMCTKYRKYCHKVTDPKCPENKRRNEKT